MNTTRTLILGGGFGGLAAATELRRRLDPKHEIVVIDRTDGFFAGLRKLWVLVGSADLEAGTRSRAALSKRPGIRFVHTEIEAVDPALRRVRTGAEDLEGDFLVIALGAEPRGDLIPGLAEAERAFDLYSADGVVAASSHVRALDEGRVVVSVAGLPYRCPPAPYEAILLLDDHFRTRGVRERLDLDFTTLQPALLPNAGREGARWVAEHFGRRGIGYATGRRLERVDGGRLVFQDGELPFDLALVVPPHRPPAVIGESELAGAEGWIAVDRGTLETAFENVYAVGDVTHIPLEGGAALPKAGLFAEAEGLRVAAAIAATLTGSHAPPPFDGKGACYLEMGGGEAALVEGAFFASGGPQVHVRGASSAYMEEKRRFESERLERWLPV